MRGPLVIAGKDLRQRFRDRSALVIGFVAPLVIAALMSFAFQGVQNVHATVAVVDLDHGPIAAAFHRALSNPALKQILTPVTMTSEAAARQGVTDKTLGAAIVIPPGFSTAASTPTPRSLTTITNINATIPAAVASSVVSSFLAQLNADRLSVVTAQAGLPVSPAQTARLSALASQLTIPVRPVAREMNAHPLKTISYYAPAMGIFFLLFAISFTTRSFFVDRAQGLIERILAAPIRPTEIIVGKALSVLVYGTASLAVVALTTTLLFGADWGYAPAAAVVGLALVVSVVSLTTLVIGLSRSERQAEGIASIVVFGLALLGGNFVFVSAEPAFMQRLALLTPNGWALRAFTDLATTGGTWSIIVEPVLAIAAFSIVAATVGALLARRAVRA